MEPIKPRLYFKRAYLKPIIGDFADYIDPAHALRILQRDLLKRFRKSLQAQSAFSERARKALGQALKAEIRQSSLLIKVKHPAFAPLIFGMPSQQMTWLVKARAPIPIVTEEGKLIFRSATPKSMKDGKWIHPGHPKTKFLDRARSEARAYVRERVREEVRRQMRRALKQMAA